jgi:hypothetical protein
MKKYVLILFLSLQTHLLVFSLEFQTEIQAGLGGYPRLTQLINGHLMLGVSSLKNEKGQPIIVVRKSLNNGISWEKDIIVSTEIEPHWDVANTTLVTLSNGDILCSYRRVNTKTHHYELPIKVSRDNGNTWQYLSTLASTNKKTGVWEPFIFEMPNAELIGSWAGGENGEQYIHLKRSFDKGVTWGKQTRITSGREGDGMPVMTYLDNGELIVVFEERHLKEEGFIYFTIVMARSVDHGRTWYDRKVIYQTPNKRGYAGAPYIERLPNDHLMVSFQTRNFSVNNSEQQISSHFAYIISDNHGHSWSSIFEPFGNSQGTEWNSLFVNRAGELFILSTGLKMLKTAPIPFKIQNYYKIIVKHSQKAIDAPHSSTLGSSIHQWLYWGGENQQWRVHKTYDGSFWFEPKNSKGKAIDMGGWSIQLGGKSIIWDYYGYNNQHWKAESVGDGYYKLINKHSSKVRDIEGIWKHNGAKVQQWDYTGGDNQKFKFEAINGSKRNPIKNE